MSRVLLIALGMGSIAVVAGTSGVGGPAAPAADAAMRPAARITPLNRNLIRNPSAEMGGGSYPDEVVPKVAGWRRTGNFTVNTYRDGLLPYDKTKTSAFGHNYFACGPLSRDARAAQRVRLVGRGKGIDAGRFKVSLFVRVSAPAAEGDRAQISMRFLGENRRPLGSKASPWVSGTPRWYVDTKITKAVPKGTRVIAVTLRGVRDAGLFCNAYFDRVKLRLLTR